MCDGHGTAGDRNARRIRATGLVSYVRLSGQAECTRPVFSGKIGRDDQRTAVGQCSVFSHGGRKTQLPKRQTKCWPPELLTEAPISSAELLPTGQGTYRADSSAEP